MTWESKLWWLGIFGNAIVFTYSFWNGLFEAPDRTWYWSWSIVSAVTVLALILADRYDRKKEAKQFSY